MGCCSPFNAVPGWLPYRPPRREHVERFRDELLARGVAVSVRWSRGAQARAACGQLALLPDRPAEPKEPAGAPARRGMDASSKPPPRTVRTRRTP